MGDRCNIVLKNKDLKTPLYIYLHWYGTARFALIARAIQDATDAGRLDDSAYFNRIFVCSISEQIKDPWKSMGLSSCIQDNDGYKLTIVDAQAKTVEYGSHKWSFTDFIKAVEDKTIYTQVKSEDEEE